MKRFETLCSILLLAATTANAQNIARRQAVTAAGRYQITSLVGTGVTAHNLSWTVSGNVSGCTVKLQQAASLPTWNDLSASYSCTSSGLSSIATLAVNNVSILVTAFSGSGSVVFTYQGWLVSPAVSSAWISPLTTKGDLFGFSTQGARLPVGTNGLFLKADSTQPLGMTWAAAGAGTITGTGTANKIAKFTGVTAIGDSSLTDTGAALSTGSSLTLSAFTPGSVPFFGTGGLLNQDNANLFWDATNKTLVVGPAILFTDGLQPATFHQIKSASDGNAYAGLIAQSDVTDFNFGGSSATAVQAFASIEDITDPDTAATAIGVDASATSTAGTTAALTDTAVQLVGVFSRFSHYANVPLTAAAGVLIGQQTIAHPGTVRSGYGLLVHDQSQATNSYAISTGLGQNSLGDRLTVKSNAAAVQIVTFTGAGLNDASSGGTYTGTSDLAYCVQIDGSVPSPDTLEWGTGGSCSNGATGVSMTAGAHTLSLGVTITFAATDGHTIGDHWDFTAFAPIPLTLQDHSGNIKFKIVEGGTASFYNGLATTGPGLVSIRGTADVPGGTTTVGSTNLMTAPASAIYHVRAYADTTTPGTGVCTMTLTIGWTDSAGAKTKASSALDVGSTGTGSFISGDFVIFPVSGNVTYTATVAGVGCTNQVWDLHLQADN